MPENQDQTVFMGVGAAVLQMTTQNDCVVRLWPLSASYDFTGASFRLNRNEDSYAKLQSPAVLATHDDARNLLGPTRISHDFPYDKMVESLYLADWFWREELSSAMRVTFPPKAGVPDRYQTVVYWKRVLTNGPRYHGFAGTYKGSASANRSRVEVDHYGKLSSGRWDFVKKTIEINLDDLEECDAHTDNGGMSTIATANPSGVVYVNYSRLKDLALKIPKLPPGLGH